MTTKTRDHEFHNALTLRGLHERLGQMIEENDRRGWSERNGLPMVVKVEQAPTPTGRLRNEAYIPVEFGGSCMIGMRAGERHVHVIALHASRGVAYVKGDLAEKIVLDKESV